MTTAPTPGSKKKVDLGEVEMAFVEAGVGATILLLHGNPTSSYLWRNIIPHLEPIGRCVAPDLIGMGDSDKLSATAAPTGYRFVDHRRYLNAFIDAVCPDGPITMVLHDWGSALGFDWAHRHPSRVNGIAYMEAIVAPVEWAYWSDTMTELFNAFRTEGIGEDMILEKNAFVEQVLPAGILRQLDSVELYEYQRPYTETGESRRPTLTWPREIPIDGHPADVYEIVASYSAWLQQDRDTPKLVINAEPGAILVGPLRDFCRTFPNQHELTVPGIHYIQEDAPDEIGSAIANWITTNQPQIH